MLREQERRRRLVDAPALAAQLAVDYAAAASVGAPPTVTAAETTAQVEQMTRQYLDAHSSTKPPGRRLTRPT